MGNKVMLVKNPVKRKKRKSTKKRARRRNPNGTFIARRAPAQKSPVARRRKRRAAPVAKRRAAPVAKRRRRRLSNPAGRRMTLRNVMDQQIMPSFISAGGALGLDVAYGYLGQWVPAQLSTGYIRYATKGAIAIGLGMLVQQFMPTRTAKKMVEGALTVTVHDALKEMTQQMMPNVPLGEYVSGMGEYVSGVGWYNNNGNANNGLGYASAGLPAGTTPFTEAQYSYAGLNGEYSDDYGGM